MGLYLVFEQSLRGSEATIAIRRILKHAGKFVWLEPPVPNGRNTVWDVIKARDLEEH